MGENNSKSRVFVTSDHHFGHENIIKYTNRPFDHVDEMNEVLIERWNDTVGENDFVYHLGDFTLGGSKTARKFFSRLNGMIFILGNTFHHDRKWLKPYGVSSYRSRCEIPVVILPPMHVMTRREYKQDGRFLTVVLCHYPLAEWDRKHYGSIHLHGHSHGKHSGGERIVDVGVDCTNFYPLNLHKLIEREIKNGTLHTNDSG